MQFIAKVIDPSDIDDKRKLSDWVMDGWEMCGCYKPSLFSRKIVVYLKRSDD